MLKIDDNNYCNWRHTPWDTKAFNLNTAELLQINYTNYLDDLFVLIEDNNNSNKIELCYFRHDSNDQVLKNVAMKNGFNVVEFSIYTTHNDVSKIPKARLKLDFVRANASHVKEIQSIAAESFEHGRFHEDPRINFSLAQKRYENWIPELVQDTEFYVFYLKDKIGGFFNYSVKNNYIEMPLSGLSKDGLKLGGFLWVNMFHFIYDIEKIPKFSNLISGSNIAVLNLYSKLGFNFGNPLFGYHKKY